MILDAELLGMVEAFLEPIVVDEDTLGFEAMQEVGPGGHFFGAAHTQSRFKTAFHKPMLSDWRNYETWEEAGSPEVAGQGQPDLEGAPRRVRAAADGRGHPRGAGRLRRPPRRRGRRPDRLLRGGSVKRETQCRRHRWWRGRRQRPVPPDEGRLDGRHAPGAPRADGRLHVARRRRHAHAQRRPERRPAPAVHDPAVRGDRAGQRPGLLHPPAGRPDARRHGGPDGLPADGRRARPLPRHGARAHLGQGGAGPLPAPRPASTSSARCTTRSRGTSTRPASPAPTSSAPRWPAPRSTSNTPVVGLSQRPDGTWDVEVESGDTIHTEHVVNAGGLWAREVGRMVGLELPVLAMEHIYLLTEDMPEVAAHVAKTGQRDADGARLRRRDLHPPGRRRDAPGHVRAGVRAVVAEGRRPGTSARSC